MVKRANALYLRDGANGESRARIGMVQHQHRVSVRVLLWRSDHAQLQKHVLTMKELIPSLLLRAGPLSIERIGAELGNPNDRTLRAWLTALRDEGRIRQWYSGRSADNGRIYTYEISRASLPLPTMRATEYRWPCPSGSRPEAVRRLFRVEMGKDG
jgi:hypothetical protein